jgi:hypothetical protein
MSNVHCTSQNYLSIRPWNKYSLAWLALLLTIITCMYKYLVRQSFFQENSDMRYHNRYARDLFKFDFEFLV